MFDSKGFGAFFLSGKGRGVKAESEKRESGNGGMRKGEGFDANCTNFLTTDGHGWTRIKNNDFDANFANYHEFFQSYGIDRLTSAINREFFVNRIDHYR
jgi:hypothetical protein